MNTRLYLMLPLVLLVAACGSAPKENASTEASFYSYPIDRNAPKVDFYDQIESVRLLGLEETDESLLQPFLVHLPTDNELLIVDEGSGVVYRYSKQGEYIDKFSHKGDGPEEYAGMQNTFWDGTALVTFDNRNSELLSYTATGEFISAEKLPTRVMHVMKRGNTWYWSKGNILNEDSLKYNLLVADEALKIQQYIKPVGEADPFPIMGSINDLRTFNDKILFNTLISDSVFVVETDTIAPFIHFDFGDEWFWTEEMRGDAGMAMGAIEQANKVWVFNWFLTNDRVELSYNLSFNDSRRGFIERKTGKFYHYSGEALEKIPVQYFGVDDTADAFFGTTNFEGLEKIVEGLDESQIEVLGSLSLEDMLNMENPTLIWVTFKPTVE